MPTSAPSKKLLQSLASLKLAVVLLVLLLIGLAAGTIIESSRGTEVAGQLVYYSPWFLGLEVALAINVLASIILYFPWGRLRIGFVTTHAAMLLILAGASVSYFFKVEGQLELGEGQSGNRFGPGLALPFTVKLDKFTVDRYPGTMRPSNFRSDVEVTRADGTTFPAGIWMNHELEVDGYRLFQSSYRMQPRPTTVLSVSKDPGQNIVFAGYTFLLIGLCTVLGTRIVAARKKAAREPERPAVEVTKKAAAAAILLLAFAPASHASVRGLPVQHDGRVMPLDTVAREAVWNVTGARSWKGEDPVNTVLTWWVDPRTGANMPLVEIGSSELADIAGMPGRTHASFLELVNNKPLMQLIDQAQAAAAEDRPRTGVLSAAEKLEGRLVWQQRFLNHDILRPIPREPQWVQAPAESRADFEALADGARVEGWPSRDAIERELTYNAVNPPRVAWIVLTIALIASLLAWNGKRKILDVVSIAGLVAGLAVMTWGIATRWAIAGRIPASNMYESLLFLAWGVGFFAVLAFALMRNRLVVLNANAMAALTMLLTDVLPIDGFVHPIPPVLSGTPWLAIHVPIIMVSYSVLALGVVVAHMQIGFTIFAPRRQELIGRMNELLYWYMLVGSILLIAGILTGSVWAASSWGRYWGWDPKEVWSLVAFLAYMAILHGRFDRFIGQFGVAAISIAAFQTILMTYLGVNFVLTTGMHSYGMGDSPVVSAMIAVAVAEAAFLLWGFVAQRRVLPAEPA